MVGSNNTTTTAFNYTFGYTSNTSTTLVVLSSLPAYLPYGAVTVFVSATLFYQNITYNVLQPFATMNILSPVSTLNVSTNTSTAAAATATACVLQECITNALSSNNSSIDQTLALVSSLADAAATQSVGNVACPSNTTSSGNLSSTSSSTVSNSILSILSAALSNSSQPLSVQSLATLASTMAIISTTLTDPGDDSSQASLNITVQTVIDLTNNIIGTLSNTAAAAGMSGYYNLLTSNSTAAANAAASVLNSVASTISSLLSSASATPTAAANSTQSLLNDEQCSVLSTSTALINSLLTTGLSGATTSGSSLDLNQGAFNASSTRLTTGSNATVQTSANVSVSVPASALQSANGQSLDLRIISVGSTWSNCLYSTNQSNNNLNSSSIYSIVLTTSNGTIVNTSNIEPPLTFTFPASYSASSADNDDTCQSDGQIHTTTPVCSWYDPVSLEWSTSGCTLGGTSSDGDVMCLCTHLTEFALLYAESEYPCTTVSTSGSYGYLIVAVVYLICFVCAIAQLAHMSIWTPSWSALFFGTLTVPRPTLLLLLHTLIALITICRCAAVLIDFAAITTSAAFGGIISLLPYVGSTVVLSLTVLQWIIIYHHAAVKQNISTVVDPSLLIRLRYRLLLSNVSIAIIVCLLYAGIFTVKNDPNIQSKLALMGVFVCTIFVAIIAICFAIYGILLVRSLTTDFTSRNAVRLLLLAISFSVVLLSQSLIQIYQLISISNTADTTYDTENLVYYSLDVLGLFLVMIMFRKSVKDYCKSHNLRNKTSVQYGTRASEMKKLSSKPSMVTAAAMPANAAGRASSTNRISSNINAFSTNTTTHSSPANDPNRVESLTDLDDSASDMTAQTAVRPLPNSSTFLWRTRQQTHENDHNQAKRTATTGNALSPATNNFEVSRQRRSSWVMLKDSIRSRLTSHQSAAYRTTGTPDTVRQYTRRSPPQTGGYNRTNGAVQRQGNVTAAESGHVERTVIKRAATVHRDADADDDDGSLDDDEDFGDGDILIVSSPRQPSRVVTPLKLQQSSSAAVIGGPQPRTYRIVRANADEKQSEPKMAKQNAAVYRTH